MAPKDPLNRRRPGQATGQARSPQATSVGSTAGIRLLSRLQTLPGLPSTGVDLAPIRPDFSDLIPAEKPTLSIQLAPCIEDVVALSGLSSELPATIEATLRDETRKAFPDAEVVSVCLGEVPDYALLSKDPETLTQEEKPRLLGEMAKLIARRQNYGIYLQAPGPGGGELARRRGTSEVDLGLTDLSALISKRGAPFGLSIDLNLLQKAANARLVAEQPRFTFGGEACSCGPLLPTGVSMRVSQPGKAVETVGTVVVIVLPEIIRAEAELRIEETLSVKSDAAGMGSLEHDTQAKIRVTKITKLDLPDRRLEIFDGSLIEKLLARVLSPAATLALGAQALASLIATRKLEKAGGVPGPLGTALEELLAPQLVLGTGNPQNQGASPGQKILFDLDKLSIIAQASQVQAFGAIVVADRTQRATIAGTATGRRTGTGHNVTFRATGADLAEPVRFEWSSASGTVVGNNGRREVTFHVEGAGLSSMEVRVEATDREGFRASDAARFVAHTAPAGLPTVLLSRVS